MASVFVCSVNWPTLFVVCVFSFFCFFSSTPNKKKRCAFKLARQRLPAQALSPRPRRRRATGAPKFFPSPWIPERPAARRPTCRPDRRPPSWCVGVCVCVQGRVEGGGRAANARARPADARHTRLASLPAPWACVRGGPRAWPPSSPPCCCAQSNLQHRPVHAEWGGRRRATRRGGRPDAAAR